MNVNSKRVVTNSLVYTISGLLQKCFSFFLLPLYTVYLSQDDYGITSLSSTFIMTMSFVVSLSLFNAIMRFYVDYNSDTNQLKRFYGTVTTFTLLSGILWMTILSILRRQLSVYVFSGIDYYPVIFVTLLSLVFNCLHTIYTYILRSEQKALKVSILDLMYFFISVGLNVTFVVGLKLGAIGVILTGCISNLLYTLYFFIDTFISNTMEWCLDPKMLKEALRYSIPLIPHNLSSQIAQLVSKVLISDTNSLAALGLYSVASQFGMIADVIQSYVHQAYQPWLFERLDDWSTSNRYSVRRTSNLLCAFIGLFFLGISLFSQDYIVLFVNKGYVDSWYYVPLIVAVFALKTTYYFYISVIFYDKNATKILFTATLSSSITNVILSALLIPKYGVYGSIAADGIAMILRVGIIYYIAINRCIDSGIRLQDFITNAITLLAFIFTGLFFSYTRYPTDFNIYNFSYKVLVVILYIVMQAFCYRDYIMAYIQAHKM